MDGGEQWVSYQQLADGRGVTLRAAVRLVQRRRWRRQKDNLGHVLVLTPRDMLHPERATRESDVAGDVAPTWAAMLAAIQTAHAGETAALRELLDSAMARLADAEVKTARVELERDQARAALQDALGAVGRLEKAEADRKARGRLRRAWDGWRAR
jgi:hypothetical protein